MNDASTNSAETSPLDLVSRIASALPSLSPGELDELADAVEALTDAIGLRRDWHGDEPTGPVSS